MYLPTRCRAIRRNCATTGGSRAVYLQIVVAQPFGLAGPVEPEPKRSLQHMGASGVRPNADSCRLSVAFGARCPSRRGAASQRQNPSFQWSGALGGQRHRAVPTFGLVRQVTLVLRFKGCWKILYSQFSPRVGRPSAPMPCVAQPVRGEYVAPGICNDQMSGADVHPQLAFHGSIKWLQVHRPLVLPASQLAAVKTTAEVLDGTCQLPPKLSLHDKPNWTSQPRIGTMPLPAARKNPRFRTEKRATSSEASLFFSRFRVPRRSSV